MKTEHSRFNTGSPVIAAGGLATLGSLAGAKRGRKVQPNVRNFNSKTFFDPLDFCKDEATVQAHWRCEKCARPLEPCWRFGRLPTCESLRKAAANFFDELANLPRAVWFPAGQANSRAKDGRCRRQVALRCGQAATHHGVQWPVACPGHGHCHGQCGEKLEPASARPLTAWSIAGQRRS